LNPTAPVETNKTLAAKKITTAKQALWHIREKQQRYAF
jgi:hypothetical protein